MNINKVNHYYSDGTLYLGAKQEAGVKVLAESGTELKTFAELDRLPKLFAKTYWPHSVLPHPANAYPVKASELWGYTALTWNLAKGQLNG